MHDPELGKPLAMTNSLISIFTAWAAPQDIATDNLKGAWKVGNKCYANFKTERLESNPPIKKVHDPMKLNKLKTFSTVSKKEIRSNDSNSPSRQSSFCSNVCDDAES